MQRAELHVIAAFAARHPEIVDLMFDELFEHFTSPHAKTLMPYGTMKARDGDPLNFITNELQKLQGAEYVVELAGLVRMTTTDLMYVLERSPRELLQQLGPITLQIFAKEPDGTSFSEYIEVFMEAHDRLKELVLQPEVQHAA